MIKKFTSLFTPASPHKSSFEHTLQKTDLFLDNQEISKFDIKFLIEAFSIQDSKENMRHFIHLIDQEAYNSSTFQLKTLITLHILMQNGSVGKRVAKSISKLKLTFIQQIFTKKQPMFQRKQHNDDFYHNLIAPYFSYVFRIAVNWKLLYEQEANHDDFLIYTIINIANLGLSLLGPLKKYSEKQNLVKLVTLTLYADFQKFYRLFIRHVGVEIKKDLMHMGERVLELHELYEQIQAMSNKMLNFYSFVLLFPEGKKQLPPISIMYPDQQVQDLKRAAAIQQEKNKKKLVIDTATIDKNDPVYYHQPMLKVDRLQVQSAKSGTPINRLNLTNLERPDKEIHTHRFEKRTIDFQAFKFAPIPQKLEQEQVKEECIEDEPELDQQFMEE